MHFGPCFVCVNSCELVQRDVLSTLRPSPSAAVQRTVTATFCCCVGGADKVASIFVSVYAEVIQTHMIAKVYPDHAWWL